MQLNVLNEQDYYRAVYGGWLGKNIGGTLGAPVEGVKELLELTFYPELPDGPLENDDLDLQLVWLHALEQYGPFITAEQLGQEWLNHIFFPFDEYGYALTNLRRGLVPPLTGSFNNPFNDCMGSPIRSEIWAMVAPGRPDIAARYAYQDAIVDHAGGEGVYGEMFFAAIESAIFYEKDRERLLEIGMQYIPAESRTAKALTDLYRWHKEGKDWLEARSLILEHHGHHNFTDAPQNVAFTILGWLYGENFEDAILKAVNCGYDTDCTAATLGAILGMIVGPEGLPAKWVDPVGDKVVVSPPINGFPAPKNLQELTERTIKVGKQVLAAFQTNTIVHPELATALEAKQLDRNMVKQLWERSATANYYMLPKNAIAHPMLEVVVEYGASGPAIGDGQTKELAITVTNRAFTTWTGYLSLQLPDGWSGTAKQAIGLKPAETQQIKLEVTAASFSKSYETLALVLERLHDNSSWAVEEIPFSLVKSASWLLFGPDEQQGKAASFVGNRIVWDNVLSMESEGVYRAVTKLYNPQKRYVKLIAAANSPIAMKLDGKEIINCKHVPDFMPAYHRAPNDQQIEMLLEVGTYEIEVAINLSKQAQPVETYVLPVATNNTADPGPYYYYTDIVFGM